MTVTRAKVVVTGAGGYIGPHVVRAVTGLGYEPVALVRTDKSSVELADLASVAIADVLDPRFCLDDVVDTAEVAALIHLAWQDGFVHDSPAHMTKLSAHFRFLTGVADAGVPRIAALGTMHEVGYWEGAIRSDTPTAPVTLYGIAKDALRRATLRTFADCVEYVWLRAYYILGDDRRNRSVFARLLEAADRGETAFPFTKGATLYDFIDVAELGRQIAVAATAPGVTGVINTGSGRPESLAARVTRFIEENDLPLELIYGAFPDRPYDSPGIWADATHIHALMASSAFARGEDGPAVR